MEKEKKLNQPQQPKQELGNAPHNPQSQFTQPKQPKTQQVGNAPHNPQGGKVAQPKQPKVDPIREKIMKQGFAPTKKINLDEDDQKLWNWGHKTRSYVEGNPGAWNISSPKSKTPAYLLHHNKDNDSYDVYSYENLDDVSLGPLSKNPINNFKNVDDFIQFYDKEVGNTYPEEAQNKKYNVSADGNHLGQVEAKDEYEAERKAQQQYPYHTDDDVLDVEEAQEREQASKLYGTDLSKPQEPEFNYNPADDAPDSPVATSELKRFAKQYLLDHGLSEEFADATSRNLGKNQNEARWYKERFKEWYDNKNQNQNVANVNGNQPQQLPEEYRVEEGVPGQDYDFYENGNFTTHDRQAASSFEEPTVAYEGLGKFYGLNLENLVYGDNGFMKEKYPNGFPDFNGDILYNEKHWDEFEDWLKQKYGVDLDKIRKEKFEEYKKTHTPYKNW